MICTYGAPSCTDRALPLQYLPLRSDCVAQVAGDPKKGTHLECRASLLPSLLGVVPGTGMLFGLMLLAAIAGGFAARWVHVPRVP